MNMQKFDQLISTPYILAVITAIGSNPIPPETWSNLYKNVLIRFIFIYIIIYQSTSDYNLSIKTTFGLMLFFYMISNEQEREDNFNFKFLQLFN